MFSQGVDDCLAFALFNFDAAYVRMNVMYALAWCIGKLLLSTKCHNLQ